MFDIGWTEILVIAVVAVVVVGPKDLPRMLRSLGRYAGQMRRMAGDFREQFEDAIRDSEFDELHSSLKETSNLNPLSQIKDSVTDSLKPLKETADDIKGGIESYKRSGKADAAAAEGSGAKVAPKKPARAKKPAAAKKSASKKKTSARRPPARRKAQAGAAKSGG